MLPITRPTLLLDETKCKTNIQRMCQKASRLGVKLVPHMKTPQSAEIAGWCEQEGVEAITVSSIKMAAYFAKAGWKDITVAFPVNVLEIAEINQMLQDGVDLKLFVVDAEVVQRLDAMVSSPVNLLIELDAGYNRTGIDADDLQAVKTVAKSIAEARHVKLYGLYCHPGNTYQTHSIEEVRQIWSTAIKKANFVRNALSQDFEDIKVRIGDTPGCTLVEDMTGVDEISAGNFIFYDLVMNYLNVCDESDIAVAMACPVVAKNTVRGEITIHGGGVHFSKDHLFDDSEQKFFGEVVILEEEGWSPIIPGIRLTSLSQEHGTLKVSEGLFDQIQIGDVLGILPIHSCLTANLMKSYTILDGKQVSHMEAG